MQVGEYEQVKPAYFIIKSSFSFVKLTLSFATIATACYRKTANTLPAKAKLKVMWRIGYTYKIISEYLELVQVSVQ